jgi:hypothetical protein
MNSRVDVANAQIFAKRKWGAKRMALAPLQNVRKIGKRKEQ